MTDIPFRNRCNRDKSELRGQSSIIRMNYLVNQIYHHYLCNKKPSSHPDSDLQISVPNAICLIITAMWSNNICSTDNGTGKKSKIPIKICKIYIKITEIHEKYWNACGGVIVWKEKSHVTIIFIDQFHQDTRSWL